MPSAEKYRDEARRTFRWRGRYRDAAGRKRSKTFDTKSAALRWAGEEEAKVHRGQRSDPVAARMKWSEWHPRWIAAKRMEPRTRRTLESSIRTHVEPRWADVPLVSISRIEVQGWVNQLASKRSASTTRKALYALSNSLNVAVGEGILIGNPCIGIELPTQPPGQERYLNDVEAGQLLYHLSGRWRVLGELLLGTGLRLSEACGLHRDRVDIEAGRIDVIETYDATEGEMRGYPKSKRRRSVPISPELASLLEEWLEEQPANRSCGKPHRAGRCPGGMLIRGEYNAPIDGHNFSERQWANAVRRAGFVAVEPGRKGKRRERLLVTIHDLRHTYASRLVQQGVPLERVQLLLGHEDIKTTQRYAHLLPEAGWDEVRAALSTSLTAARAAAVVEAGRVGGERGAVNGALDGADTRSNSTQPATRARRLHVVSPAVEPSSTQLDAS